jgi:deoxyhypusine synthase
MAVTKGPISQFMNHHYRHFNAAAMMDAVHGYEAHLASGGKMMVTLAGAMSTAELGLSLADMIRNDKVHAISCTGANLEEDIYNLVAHDHYERLPNWRDLTKDDEQKLYDKHLNRVTDTCFPHEFFYRALKKGKFTALAQIDPKNSWMLAAAEKNIPMVVPGWEDSTLGNMYASFCMRGEIKNVHTVRTGIEYMTSLAEWYMKTAETSSIGFFQIGGGIAGDFPICVVPMIRQDLEKDNIRLWGYFCQISDSTTSYGSYSGAVPNEKITWGKLSKETPSFIVESDATIVAPLMFAHILGW